MLLENIYIIVGLILASIIFFQSSKRAKLNEPPLAYYRFPIIGHTWSHITNCEKLILESRKKYGETFSLYVFGRIMTVVGKETCHEILKKDREFSQSEGLKPYLPLDYILTSSPEKNLKIVNDFIIGKFKHLTVRLQKEVIKAIDIYIGECDEQKVINDPYETLLNIISIPIANIIVGEECYHHEDMLETFRNVTKSLSRLIVPPILALIHPWLHQQFITLPLRFGWNPISKHRAVIINRIKPIIEKRLYDKKRLGDTWVAPLDALQCFLDDPEITPVLDANNVNYIYIADAICGLIFSSVDTTSSNATRALYYLAKRKECWQELYKEAQEINKQCNNNVLTLEDINKMVKLDSFIKESLRISDFLLKSPRVCVSKSYYTTESGYQIPEGRLVATNVIDTSYDENLQGQNPMEFYAYRYLERNSPATKLERSSLLFGAGKHACPGRILAINEIKVFLHKILLKYNVSIENVPRKYVASILERTNVSIVFENRKDINQIY